MWCSMAKPLVSDELWEIIQPLLPAPKPRRFRNPGRQPLDDIKALTGILFVLKSGIPWEMLPQEMGLWFRDDPVSSTGQALLAPRLRDWQQAGVWQKLHEMLLSRLHGADRLDWSRACVDSASVRAVGGGEKDRPQSYGPGQAREQASRAHRGQRNTSVGHPDRGQSPGRNPVVFPGGGRAAGARSTGPSPSPAPAAVRRPGL